MANESAGILYFCAGKRNDAGDRVACGANITPLVVAIPQNGKDYETTCPKCGCVASVMRTPPAAEPDPPPGA